MSNEERSERRWRVLVTTNAPQYKARDGVVNVELAESEAHADEIAEGINALWRGSSNPVQMWALVQEYPVPTWILTGKGRAPGHRKPLKLTFGKAADAIAAARYYDIHPGNIWEVIDGKRRRYKSL